MTLDKIYISVRIIMEVIGSFIGMAIVGFWFGIGFMIAVKTVNNREELIRR